MSNNCEIVYSNLDTTSITFSFNGFWWNTTASSSNDYVGYVLDEIDRIPKGFDNEEGFTE